MMAEADLELVQRAKAGDRSAFDDLVGPLIGQAFRLRVRLLRLSDGTITTAAR
jgi:hypothetical protein